MGYASCKPADGLVAAIVTMCAVQRDGKLLCYYLHQGGYVVVVVCLSAQKLQTDLREIFREGCNGPVNKCLNFCGDPDHGSRDTVKCCALAEVCSVPVLLVAM